MNKKSKIYIAGHRGLVGSAVNKKLQSEGYKDLIYQTHEELDLTRQNLVEEFFENNRPEYVILMAGKVGGIGANSQFPAHFYYINNMIATNVIHSAYKYGVKKLLYLGSSCIYPRMANQPIIESELLKGELEKTNEAYALAKIGGLKMCDYYREQYGCNFISAMPTSIYGINDNFNLNNSHLIPALIRKFHEAKIENKPTVTIWGTGKPFRELLYADDLADGLSFLMNKYNSKGHINIGTGKDLTVLEYVNIIKKIAGYKGEIVHDLNKPDGTPKKQLDVSKLNQMGWFAKTTIEKGISIVYNWFSENYEQIISG